MRSSGHPTLTSAKIAVESSDPASGYERNIAVLKTDLMLAEAKRAQTLAELRGDEEHSKYLEQVAITRAQFQWTRVSVVLTGLVSFVAMIISIIALLKWH